MQSEVWMEAIRRRLSEKLGEGYEVERTTALKNHGVEAEGISVRKVGDVLAAILYPRPSGGFCREEQTPGEEAGDVDGCVEELLKTYRSQEGREDGFRELVRRMMDWEEIRSYIRPQLLSCMDHQRLIPRLVYRRFQDLAVVYAARTECGSEWGTVRIERPVFESWGISEEELHRQALKNLEQDGYFVQSIPEALGMEPLLGAGGAFLSAAVLTNRSRLYGVAGILLPDMLEEYAKKVEANLFLLPSSVHEFLLLPDDGQISIRALNQMVKEVNQEEVPPMDRLSDHVYYYDRESRLVEWRDEEEGELKGLMRKEGSLGAV